VPAEACRAQRHEQRTQQRTHVDAHVEQRKPASRRDALGVEIGNECADIGLSSPTPSAIKTRPTKNTCGVPEANKALPTMMNPPRRRRPGMRR